MSEHKKNEAILFVTKDFSGASSVLRNPNQSRNANRMEIPNVSTKKLLQADSQAVLTEDTPIGRANSGDVIREIGGLL